MRAAALAILVLIPLAYAGTFCIPVPDVPHTYVRYRVGDVYKDFSCVGDVCCGNVDGNAQTEILITREGEAAPIKFPLFITRVKDVYRAAVGWGDHYTVTYVNNGKETVRVEENYPKDMAAGPDKFEGTLIFYETDPVIVFYLSPGEENAFSYKVYTRDPPLIIPYVELATCQLRVTDVSYERQGEGVLISFRVLDGGRPVYITGMTVLIDGSVFTPQYDARSDTYTLFARLEPGTHRVVIRGEAEGCPALVYTYSVEVSGFPPLPFLLLGILLLLGFLLWRKRSRS